MSETSSVAADIAAIQAISVIPAMLRIVTEMTGMRFAAVARVSGESWTACAVLDKLNFGLPVGGQLDVTSTLCHEIHSSHEAIVIDEVSASELYRDHHTPRIYGFSSYISVPIFRTDGSFFGTICALDPLPRPLSQSTIEATMTSFARMLTLQLEAEQRFERTAQALSEAQQLGEIREQFIAVLGHDLRNPLQAMIASAELLERQSSEPKTLRGAQRILSSGRRAAQLVDDILDFARDRLGSGIVLKKVVPVDLATLLLQVVTEIQVVNPSRIISADIGTLAHVECDPPRIAQLLSNLLANAISHGGAAAKVSVLAQEQSRFDEQCNAMRYFVLSVTNGGEPIPTTTLSHLFKPYWRPAGAVPGAGLGLGLYIVKQIAQAHGGDMQVSSTLEQGTTFTFTMPLVGQRRAG